MGRQICKNMEISLSNGVPQGSILGPLLFLIFFNDITECVQNAEIIKYADDTVLFFPAKDLRTIEVNLSHDIERIATWFEENELIINLKKGKSEVMLFGTSQKLSKLRDTLQISYRGSCINVTSHYKYLGVDIDSTLNLNSHFDRTYKKATGRLKLLGKLRGQLDEKSAKAIYTSMIVPTVTYNCILQGSLTVNQKHKLSSIVNRAKSIIQDNQQRDVSLPSLENETKKQTCFFVKKCLDGVICDEFKDLLRTATTQLWYT